MNFKALNVRSHIENFNSKIKYKNHDAVGVWDWLYTIPNPLWYMEWLANENLLYGTEKFIFCDGSMWEKNLEKNGYVYMCNWLTLLYKRNYHNIVNQWYFNKNLKNNTKLGILIHTILSSCYLLSHKLVSLPLPIN